MKQALVSILLSTYNGAAYIAESLDSVLSQDYKNIECIIINDASTDAVESIILEYAKQDSRIHYIKNITNLGLTQSLNKGLEYATGTYIARIDDDDIRLPSKLTTQVEFMEAHDAYGVCGTATITIDPQGSIIDTPPRRSTNDDIKKHILLANQFTHSSILMRSSCLDHIGGYNPVYNGIEDYELWLRMGVSYMLHNIQTPYVHYRVHTTSISQKKRFFQNIQGLSLAWNYRSVYPRSTRAILLRIATLLFPVGLLKKIRSYSI